MFGMRLITAMAAVVIMIVSIGSSESGCGIGTTEDAGSTFKKQCLSANQNLFVNSVWYYCYSPSISKPDPIPPGWASGEGPGERCVACSGGSCPKSPGGVCYMAILSDGSTDTVCRATIEEVYGECRQPCNTCNSERCDCTNGCVIAVLQCSN